jgi:hypothetical protein
MNRRLLIYGCVLWILGTAGVRLWGRYLLHPGSLLWTLLLFGLSFAAMALLARRLCQQVGLPRGQWPSGAVALALPTLLLDPFSSAFFPWVFPQAPPAASGLFGGWMLCCCAGALIGSTIGSVTEPRQREALAG